MCSEVCKSSCSEVLQSTQDILRNTQKYSGTAWRNLWGPQEYSKILRNILLAFLVERCGTQKYSEIFRVLRNTLGEPGNTQKYSDALEVPRGTWLPRHRPFPRPDFHPPFRPPHYPTTPVPTRVVWEVVILSTSWMHHCPPDRGWDFLFFAFL